MTSDWTLYTGDCLDVLPTLAANSVDLIAVDPPYYKVKGEAWDRQWDTADGFIAWIGRLCQEWQRVLKPNGSLYVFASPRMAARVEVEVGKWFNVLNQIVWQKKNGNANWRADKELVRAFLPNTERIIFAEHYGADNMAKGEAGYATKCDELRGFLFEPLRAYLAGERDRAGLTTRQVAEEYQKKTGSRTVTGMAGHWLERSQWTLPTAENYQWLRETFTRLNHGGEYLRREYEDLRREYEDLRREYEDLRRPFNVSPDVPYTDVWTFPTVAHYPGKHPTEKPLAMMRHIIKASSRVGSTVLDCCMVSGTTGVAAVLEGRRFIGVELLDEYTDIARRRIEHAAGQARQLELGVGNGD